MRLTLALTCLCGLLLGGCMLPVGEIPPQRVTRENPEPRTIELSQLAAKMGWVVEDGSGAGAYMMKSPQGDRVLFKVDSDVLVLNETYWRFERDAVQKDGFEVLLPESVFVFLAKHFGRHELLRDIDHERKISNYDLEPVEPLRPVKGPAKAAPRGNALKGVTICIDPGHGGKDPGGMGNGVRECDITLSVGMMLKDMCEAEGATVVMTRTTDVYPELEERCELANSKGCDFFVSVHANIAPNDSSVTGFECFYNGDSAESAKLAKAINAAVDSETEVAIRGAKKDPRGLRVLCKTRMPATLIELGFMSNREEAKLLATKSHQMDMAKAVFKGMCNFARSGKTVSK
ncbi:MAG: N-acetylmuramoyl-L-alanine amidase [Planctomycetes bacterium]|nr:N-acetylmuramoyl-L-alanine amidase [Planctomycetota bacterium]